MRKCLDYDQNKRFTAQQLLNHDWFNEDENGNIDRVDIIKQNAIKLDYIKFMNKKSYKELSTNETSPETMNRKKSPK